MDLEDENNEDILENELNDFESSEEDETEVLDESEERYNMRVFKSGMEAREQSLKGSVMFFDESTIEGAPDGNNKTV